MPIDPEGSVTLWIANLQVGQANQAEHDLWDRYFRRLVALARMKLGDAPRIAEDEEDVAVSALRSFYSGVAAGRFPNLEDRHNLWALLAKITACKAINQRNRQLAQKRGGGRVLSEAQIAQPSSMNERQLAEFVEDGLTPDFVAAINEQCEALMNRLSDDKLRLIAHRKLEGYTNEEIAQELGVVERTVERKLALIRSTWMPELADSGSE
ncbi:MAG: RNA polymerase subunit sigma-70 [Planctomycetes bacterium]|nr:RNA polymerase subunit sigma-70 [Planctomycetota bacterium]